MSPILVGVAIATSVGAIVAISARDARTALVGLAVTMAAAPFLADPLPALPTLALRVVAAVLAAYLLRAAVVARSGTTDRNRSQDGPVGSRVGWPTEAILALAAWAVGINVSVNLLALNPAGPGVVGADLLGSLGGGSLSTGAGLAAIVLAIVPALGSKDGLRTAIGLLVLIEGLLLLRVGVAGPPSDLEHLAGVALLIAAAITGSMLVGLGASRKPPTIGGPSPIPDATAARVVGDATTERRGGRADQPTRAE